MAHGELQATGSVHLPLLSSSTPSLALLAAQLTPVLSPLSIVPFCLVAERGRTHVTTVLDTMVYNDKKKKKPKKNPRALARQG